MRPASRLWTGAALFAAMAALFLIANRGAYEGYFDGDDLDNIAWTRVVPLAKFVPGLLAPKFYPQNFRPLGHLYYGVMVRTAGLEFPRYVAVLHAAHFLSVLALWFVLRRFGLPRLAAGAGAVFFAFHMAVFDAYWKPMYIFDVLCGALCLLSLLCYMHRKWVLSLACLWLAYKAKEPAVMLPAVLALYEYWFGERRWKRLIPFFAVSLLFGLQGLLLNPNVNNDYTIRAGPEAIWKTVTFYSSLLFLLPYAGLALLLVPLLVRDRRVYLGVAWLCLLLVPMLLLPGRLFAAYLYAPLAGAAIGFAAVIDACAKRGLKPAWQAAIVMAFFAVWIPWNHARLRAERRAALTAAYENRSYVATLGEMAKKWPELRLCIYDGLPATLHVWGLEGALRYFYPQQAPEVHSIDDQDSRKAFRSGSSSLLNWDPALRKLVAIPHTATEPDAAYVRIAANRRSPVWQLGEGWYPWEYSFRWIKPRATATLGRPAGARKFELVAHMGPDQMRDLGKVTVTVFLDGRPLGSHEFTRHGIQPIEWDVPEGPAGPAAVEFRVEPEYRPDGAGRPLGIPIAGFGFK